MSKSKSDHLFRLIKTLKKSEKRYFKITNQHDSSSTKFMDLFDAIDRQDEFDDESLLSDHAWINPGQFSNLKAHLYKKVLKSLKDYGTQASRDIQAHERIDEIQLLYDRGLYQQCILQLKKMKRSMLQNENLELWLEVLKWEKILLPYSSPKNIEPQAKRIIQEANEVSARINRVNELTNLALELNAIYRRTGYIRNEQDFKVINQIFLNKRSELENVDLSKNEYLVWCEINVAYFSFIQDFNSTYLYAKKWVELFNTPPDTSYYFEMYIRGLNKLLNAQAKLNFYHEFILTQRQLRNLADHRLVQLNENIRLRMTKYNYAHQFNTYFINGDFLTGVTMLRKIERRMEQFIGTLDKHSEMVLFYKIACLYFGNRDYADALKWLNRIINSEEHDIREDVHSFARILNLVTHFELGNRDVIDYYLRSTYRFLHKKSDLNLFQYYILDFIKKLNWEISETELKTRFTSLHNRMMELSDSSYHKRAFVYFDIISWLESKIENKPVAEVIQEKFERTRTSNSKQKLAADLSKPSA